MLQMIRWVRGYFVRLTPEWKLEHEKALLLTEKCVEQQNALAVLSPKCNVRPASSEFGWMCQFLIHSVDIAAPPGVKQSSNSRDCVAIVFRHGPVRGAHIWSWRWTR